MVGVDGAGGDGCPRAVCSCCVFEFFTFMVSASFLPKRVFFAGILLTPATGSQLGSSSSLHPTTTVNECSVPLRSTKK